MVMHDNVRSHIAGIVQQYLQQVKIPNMVWPPKSPELNPKEHMWDAVGRRLRQLPNPRNTLNDLFLRLVEIWRPCEKISCLYEELLSSCN